MFSKKVKAFTLAELLVSASILSVTLSGMLAVFMGSAILNEASRNLSIAANHAEYTLESIRNLTFSGISTAISSGNYTWNTDGVTSQGLTALKSEAITTTCSGTTLLDITVTVTWNDTQARNRTFVLRTLMSDT